MKFLKTLQLTAFSALILFYFISCDDAGIDNPVHTTSLTLSKFKTLNANQEGLYELWVSFSTTADYNDTSYISMGKFNVTAQGQPVDTTGQPKVFNFRRNPGNIINAVGALITIQQPGNNDTIPTGTKMIGGNAVISSDFISFNLSMAYSEILGNVATKFLTDTCKYILNTPTTQNTADWDQGIWLTKDTLDSSTGLTCNPLQSDGDWLYEGFIYLAANPNLYYSIGKFPDPRLSDDNYNCQGPAFQYDKPGQDWIEISSTCDTLKLNTGAYNFMITIRPKQISFLNAHYIKLFDGTIGVAGYGSVGIITNTAANYLPTGVLQISRE